MTECCAVCSKKSASRAVDFIPRKILCVRWQPFAVASLISFDVISCLCEWKVMINTSACGQDRCFSRWIIWNALCCGVLLFIKWSQTNVTWLRWKHIFQIIHSYTDLWMPNSVRSLKLSRVVPAYHYYFYDTGFLMPVPNDTFFGTYATLFVIVEPWKTKQNNIYRVYHLFVLKHSSNFSVLSKRDPWGIKT